MQVFWSKSAKQDRYDIALYISQESVDAACAMLDRFDQAAVYEIINETVIILAVLHTSKQYPPIIQ